MGDWNPEQYERFRDERARPFHDLLSLVEPVDDARVVDLGCGTGELTRLLHERLRARSTLGVDSSEAMLAKAVAHVAPGLSFVRGDIAFEPRDGPFDVVFSNAALHWLPDLDATIARLAGLLAPGGQLAVQIPQNFDHASHRLAVELAAEAPFAEHLGGFRHPGRMHPPEEVAALLHRLGFGSQRVRLEVYGHPMARRLDVVEWVKGTLLVPLRQRMPPDVYDAFLARYAERLEPALGASDPTFYPFKRLLFWARR